MACSIAAQTTCSGKKVTKHARSGGAPRDCGIPSGLEDQLQSVCFPPSHERRRARSPRQNAALVPLKLPDLVTCACIDQCFRITPELAPGLLLCEFFDSTTGLHRSRTNGFEGKPYRPAKHPSLASTMMPSRSTPNLQSKSHPTIYSYLQPTSSFKGSSRDDDSPPPAPPVRDSSSLKSIKYGPGHEKFPSWPVPAAAETPQALRGPPSGGSHRSKSWTDHTNYPKEKVVAYTRPYMKRQHSAYTQQKLKTVMERCEKIPPETYESRYNEHLYLSHVDRDGKPLGDMDYLVPSPPERDLPGKPQLTQADLEEYARSYQEPSFDTSLTKSGLEEFMEYTRHYDDSKHLHQKQLSYAQSEGYHSYVSSSDSTSTPFLDRLRRDSEAVVTRPSWDEAEQEHTRREGRDSVVTTSSGSVSSSETLKWHGSMSDVSVASSSYTHLANSSSSVSRQLIAHSARVQTPQRHHSESVLYMGGENPDSWKDKESRNNNANKLKLFPVNTYTVQEADGSVNSRLNPALSVQDRISELEKQQKYSYLDPEKKHKVPDPTLKAIQKKALLSFYERHQNPNKNNWRSEPQLIPQPPPRVKVQLPSRRASSASDYSSGNNSKRSSLASTQSKTTESIKTVPKHQYSNSCGSLSTDLLGPIIVGPSISVDDWVPDNPPARPPKNPHLRTAFPDLFNQRVPSPDLPPPSPPPVLEDEVFHNDDPLPPPPPECNDWVEDSQVAAPQVEKNKSPIKQTVGLPEQCRYSSVRSSIKTRPAGHIIQQVSSRPYNGGLNQYAKRSSTKYPATQKLVLNGNVAVSQKVVNGSDQYRAEPLKPIQKEGDLKKAQRASIAEGSIKDVPPPLQPRQARVNQSMRGRISHAVTVNSSPKGEKMREGRSQSMSQSKASYLASRRDRIVPDSETGSYKRTMSPNGHTLNETITESSKEPVWSINRPTKDLVKTNNNTNLLRRSSMNEKSKKSPEKEDIVLPDVLPINAKMYTQYRPTPENAPPPESPTKTPPRGSPFTPLRSTNLSNPPLLASYIKPVSPHESPPSPKIKQSLSPMKLSPLRTSPEASPKPSPPPSPRKTEECPKVVEGLQLIQRTEVVLRVNTSTTDAASQTEKDELPPTPLPTRKKLQEEIECEKLSEDFINHLPTSDRLKELLVPGPDYKKPTDYVQGLFRVDVTSRPRPVNSPFRSRNNTPSCSPPPIVTTVTTATTPPKISSTTSPMSSLIEPTSPLSGSSTYFTISEPKAKFLTRYSQDMNQCHIVKNTKDLTLKKEELVNRLDRKLEVLRSEQLVVSEECKINDELGENVEAHIRRLARPHEADKFRLHIEEVGKITSLLLGLSGRLARAENALMGMPEDHPERRILESKRDKLQDQLEEAKKLKECIDRRSVSVSNILYKYLNSEEYTDYDHFINMKAKLIMDSKEIADKIKLGEEQLLALKETLIIAD
nr:PREDICTED: protein Shroom isoform X1 [Tribolium castaneum]|eukprot:XP_008199092.1 PREDICTED: protein Shroom isoform X1 [Tribolium castaneum]